MLFVIRENYKQTSSVSGKRGVCKFCSRCGFAKPRSLKVLLTSLKWSFGKIEQIWKHH